MLLLITIKRFLPAFASAGLLFSTASVFGDALDNWHWRNPLPNGNFSQVGSVYGITFADGKLVSVGDFGVVFISGDATNWTPCFTPVTSRLNSVVYGGGKFVAVGEGGTVISSTDGTNWTAGDSGDSGSLHSIAYGNGIFAAVGAAGIKSSTDGLNWSSRSSGYLGGDFSEITYGTNGFMAVGFQVSPNFVYQSVDGVVWTSQTLETPSLPGNYPTVHEIVTYTGGEYLIGSTKSTYSSVIPYIFTSPDGHSWTTNAFVAHAAFPLFQYGFFMAGSGMVVAVGLEPTSTSWPFGWSLQPQFSTNVLSWSGGVTTLQVPSIYPGINGVFGEGKFVVVYGLQVFLSTNCINWTTNVLFGGLTGSGDIFKSMSLGNNSYVAVGNNTEVRSTNGLVYTVISNAPPLVSMSYATNGFIGAGLGGKIYQSADGLSWTQRNSGTPKNLYCIVNGGGLTIAVGDGGTIQTSSTGAIWTSRNSGSSLPLYGVAYANGLFVVIGQSGTVLTSPDGISWTGQDSGQLTNLLSVTYGSAGFVAVGPGGTILTSPDGINWTKQNPGTLASFESVTFGNGYYLVVGDGAVAMTSPDGVNWTPRNIGAMGGQNLYGAAFLNSRFIVVGSGGTVLESDAFASLFDVQIRRNSGKNWLTVFATPGINFRIQTCTNLAAPNWTDAASFNNASAITQWTNSPGSLGQSFYRVVSP
jgi:hypothetical protein